MKMLSLIELLHLSRQELRDELAKLTNRFAELPEGSADCFIARINLRLIRQALALRTPHPP